MNIKKVFFVFIIEQDTRIPHSLLSQKSKIVLFYWTGERTSGVKVTRLKDALSGTMST